MHFLKLSKLFQATLLHYTEVKALLKLIACWMVNMQVDMYHNRWPAIQTIGTCVNLIASSTGDLSQKLYCKCGVFWGHAPSRVVRALSSVCWKGLIARNSTCLWKRRTFLKGTDRMQEQCVIEAEGGWWRLCSNLIPHCKVTLWERHNDQCVIGSQRQWLSKMHCDKVLSGLTDPSCVFSAV